MTARFPMLTFERQVDAPVETLWQAWTAPAARAAWAAPSPDVTVEFLETDTRVGGREVSLCRVEGQPDIRCECGWLHLQPARRSVNYEVISSPGDATRRGGSVGSPTNRRWSMPHTLEDDIITRSRRRALVKDPGRKVSHVACAIGSTRSNRTENLPEKARTAVTWLIRHALRRIETAPPAPGRHLAGSHPLTVPRYGPAPHAGTCS